MDSSNPKPNVTAFGEAILLRSIASGPNEEPMNGTSFASPLAAGMAAALIGEVRARGRSLPNQDLIDVMQRSASMNRIRLGNRNSAGHGLINLVDGIELVSPSPHVSMLHIPRAVISPLIRTAAIPAAAVSLLWLFSVDKIAHLKKEHGTHLKTPRRITLVGRVHGSSMTNLWIDDGTGTTPLTWENEWTRPRRGQLVIVSGNWSGTALHGDQRFLLAETRQH